MCGIIGFSGTENCVPLLLEGLKTLSYRGYDSAGIAVHTDGGVTTVKAKGKLEILEEKLKTHGGLFGTCGIGHTRWATHGAPSDGNSHPHSAPSLTLVHNGIIENYASLTEKMRDAGYIFLSETDTEAAAFCLDSHYRALSDPLAALFRSTADFEGSFAFGVLYHDRPGKLYAIRRGSPLIVAKTESGSFIASDIPAILPYTREYYRLPEDICAVLDGAEISFFDRSRNPVSVKPERVDWDVEAAQRGGFSHFMLKEIHEEPEVLVRTVQPYLKDGLPYFGVEALDGDVLAGVERIHIVACGTAMHAGLLARQWIEASARVPVTVEIASEFRGRDPILLARDMVLFISQSGETADTLAALRLVKARGVRTAAIVNVVGSTVAREADDVIYTRAGPEIAVASTKAYIVQCAVLYLLTVRLALVHGRITAEEARRRCRVLLGEVPGAIEETITLAPQVEEIAARLKDHPHIFYIGRGADSVLCTEGALKLKEISYLHSEAYAAGELKHGTISLVEEGTPVIALLTEESLADKTVSAIREVKARGAYVIAVAALPIAESVAIPADCILTIPAPSGESDFAVLPAMTAMQMIAYYTAAIMGLDVDRPRNLAKSVTVE